MTSDLIWSNVIGQNATSMVHELLILLLLFSMHVKAPLKYGHHMNIYKDPLTLKNSYPDYMVLRLLSLLLLVLQLQPVLLAIGQ